MQGREKVDGTERPVLSTLSYSCVSLGDYIFHVGSYARKVRWADTASLCIQTAQELKLCIAQVPALIPSNCASYNTIWLPEILVSPIKGR